MSHYKPYPAYKDSGVEWLGKVPEHWISKKLMHWISTGYGSGTTPSDESYYVSDESGVAWVTTGELRENTINKTEKYVTERALTSHSALKVHPAGSLIIAMYGATIGRLGVLGVDAALNQACFAIHPPKTIDTTFLRYWFEGFRSELIELGTGGGQPNISADKIRNLVVSAPSSEDEQNKVIAHIDRETTRIDALITKKTRFIELLREKRQALITHAVTKGLDPNVKIKDSGVEWQGEVPEHWSVKKLLYWIATGSGSGTTPADESYYVNDKSGIPWVTTGELRENTIHRTEKYVTEHALASHSALRVHPAGSLIIAMYGATIGRLGLLGVEATLNQACFAIHPPKTIATNFLRYWFEGFRNELIELGTGGGQPNISADKIRNLVVSAPVSEDEQNKVIAHLDRETARIDSLIAKSERSIALLKERRSALIIAAVTGQIDLREQIDA